MTGGKSRDFARRMNERHGVVAPKDINLDWIENVNATCEPRVEPTFCQTKIYKYRLRLLAALSFKIPGMATSLRKANRQCRDKSVNH